MTIAGEAPAVDDIAIEDETFAADVLEEVRDFVGLAMRRAKVDVGENDGADV